MTLGEYSDSPVFLIPFPRMGGTLFATMLDAHPDLSMSYEIYEGKLFDDFGVPLDAGEVVSILKSARKKDTALWTKGIEPSSLRSFVACARRGDVDVNEFLGLLEDFSSAGGELSDVHGRLSFIEKLMLCKMRKAGKSRWGGKAKADPEALFDRYPNACFFAMVRDGRDVMASQLGFGTFNVTPHTAAQNWREFITGFKKFSSKAGCNAKLIKYEDLVGNPEQIMKDVCNCMRVDYCPSMLDFHEQDMSLFRKPHGHMSVEKITLGLNAGSIGRWKDELTAEATAEFVSLNSDLMAEFGYAQ